MQTWLGMLVERTCYDRVSPRFIRNPLLINVLIHPGDDPEDLPSPVGDDDVAADTVQYVHSLRLPGLPGSGHEGVGLAGQSSHRAQILTDFMF